MLQTTPIRLDLLVSIGIKRRRRTIYEREASIPGSDASHSQTLSGTSITCRAAELRYINPQICLYTQ